MGSYSTPLTFHLTFSLPQLPHLLKKIKTGPNSYSHYEDICTGAMPCASASADFGYVWFTDWYWETVDLVQTPNFIDETATEGR